MTLPLVTNCRQRVEAANVTTLLPDPNLGPFLPLYIWMNNSFRPSDVYNILWLHLERIAPCTGLICIIIPQTASRQRLPCNCWNVREGLSWFPGGSMEPLALTGFGLTACMEGRVLWLSDNAFYNCRRSIFQQELSVMMVVTGCHDLKIAALRALTKIHFLYLYFVS